MEICSGHDVNNLIFRTCSVFTIGLPLLGIQIVCHARHKIVPGFLLILYVMDENHINRFTDVKPVNKAVYTWGRFILAFKRTPFMLTVFLTSD